MNNKLALKTVDENPHRGKSLLETKFDCKFTFPIDLAPNGIPFGVDSIGAVKLQSKFGFDNQDSKNISQCV